MSDENDMPADKKDSTSEDATNSIGTMWGFSAGFLTTLLAFSTGLFSEAAKVEGRVAVLILVLLAVFLIVLLLAKKEQSGVDLWGFIGFFLLGGELGILAYSARTGFAEQWKRYNGLGGLNDAILAGLLVFGVLIGVLVVRVWNKEESDFVKSVSASFGGAILPPLLGKTINVDSGQAFAAYFLGFAVSAVVNVVYCAKLIGNYTNKRCPESRARLDFMYGKDKAEAVDKYFLKNFLENKDTVRLLLTQTLKTYNLEVRKGLAARLSSRRKIEDHLRQPHSKASQTNETSSHVGSAKRTHYYELLSIDPADPHADGGEQHHVEFRPISKDEEFSPSMFRVGITVKWLDNLEYVVAPGTYKKTLPYKDSVAGLALQERKVIVMSRDQDKTFRGGVIVKSKEQKRGFMETNYVSYISIPIVSDLGYQEETELGIVNVDTMLFASESELEQKAKQVNKDRWRLTITTDRLREYGSNLYDDPDKTVDYLEEVATVINPVLRLYLICRQGSV